MIFISVETCWVLVTMLLSNCVPLLVPVFHWFPQVFSLFRSVNESVGYWACRKVSHSVIAWISCTPVSWIRRQCRIWHARALQVPSWVSLRSVMSSQTALFCVTWLCAPLGPGICCYDHIRLRNALTSVTLFIGWFHKCIPTVPGLILRIWVAYFKKHITFY